MEYSNSTQALSESVNNLGDMLKEATMDIEPVFSLAQKKPKAAQQTNYAKTAAGATFGVIALASVIALARSNKKTADNQESLL